MENFVEVPECSYFDSVKTLPKELLLDELLFVHEQYVHDLMAANFKIVRLEKELSEYLT